jgi:hypothetical protein
MFDQQENPMSQITSILFGGLICCVVPLASFGAGMYYARFGFPVALQWRGIGRAEDDEVDD